MRMNTFMVLQTIATREPSATDLANIRFLSGMSAVMTSQLVHLLETIIASIARETFWRLMFPFQMFVQTQFIVKRPATQLTNNHFGDVVMSFHMNVYSALVFSREIALITFKQFYQRMRSFVDIVTSFGGKTLTTFVANERLLQNVALDVRLQSIF